MIIRPIHPFAFSDQRYWDAAKKVDVDRATAVLEAQGWEHARVDDGELFRRVDFDDQIQNLELPLVNDERFAARVLDAAFLLSVYDYKTVDEALEEWGAPCERRDVAAELRRRRRNAPELVNV